MAKVGLKDTLALLAKGYSKKEIDALAAVDEESEKESKAPAPAQADNSVNPVPSENPAQDDATAKNSNPEPDYKKMYEELLEKNKQTEAKVTKLQKENVNKDSSGDAEEQKKKQAESLLETVRGFM